MSKKASSAVNQQGSLLKFLQGNNGNDPSETTRRAPISKKIIKAYLLGAIHDGTLNKGKRFRISQKGISWLKILQQLFSYLGYNSWIYKEGKARKVYVLETLADFLNFNLDLSTIKSREEKKAYIRGFFDAEGGLPHKNHARFYIQLVQKDKAKLLWIKRCLEGIGIRTGKIHNPSARIDPNYWRMYVLSDSQNSFVRQIGSWHPRKRKILRDRMMI